MTRVPFDTCERNLPRRGWRSAFTLLESLIAAGILLVSVVAVTSAISAGQQNAYESQQRVTSAIAAEEMLGRLLGEDYEELAAWDGYEEAVGTMTNAVGVPMPETFSSLGRRVEVQASMQTIVELGINVQGRMISVIVFDRYGRELVTLDRFVPEPSSS